MLTDVAKTSPKSGQRRFQDLQIDDGKLTFICFSDLEDLVRKHFT